MQQRDSVCLALSAACAEESFGKGNRERPAEVILLPTWTGSWLLQRRSRAESLAGTHVWQPLPITSRGATWARPENSRPRKPWRRARKQPDLAPGGLAFLDPRLNLGDLLQESQEVPFWPEHLMGPSSFRINSPGAAPFTSALMPHSASLARQGLHGSRLQRGGVALFPGTSTGTTLGAPRACVDGSEMQSLRQFL